MSKIIVWASMILPLLVVQPAMAKNSNSENNSSNHSKVSICHATGSKSNPFVEITINESGWLNGHKGHQNRRDFIVTGEQTCPSKNEANEEKPKVSKEVSPQILGVSSEVSAATSLPKGGGNSNLATSLMAGFGLILVSALLSEVFKKLRLV